MSLLIAGLAEGENAAAALVEVVGGQTIVHAVVHQQSCDRMFHSAAFPSAALDACLDVAGKKAKDLDRIVITNVSALPRRWAGRVKVTGRVAATLRTSGVYRLLHDRAADRIEAWARGAGFHASVATLEADLAHASLAYRTQDADAVRILVAGETRDGTRQSSFEARHGQVDPLPEPGGSIPEAARKLRKAGQPLLLAGTAFHAPFPDLLSIATAAPLVDNAGAALGAALWEAGTPPRRLPSLDLGPGFTSDAAYKALSNAQQPRDRRSQGEIVAAAAEALRAGHLVAWACGRAGARGDLLPGRALLSLPGASPSLGGVRLVVGSAAAGEVLVTEPTLAAVITETGPLNGAPIARPGEPAALTPSDVIRVFRGAGANGGRAPALLVLDAYVV